MYIITINRNNKMEVKDMLVNNIQIILLFAKHDGIVDVILNLEDGEEIRLDDSEINLTVWAWKIPTT